MSEPTPTRESAIKTTPQPCAICNEEWFVESNSTMADGGVACDDCLDNGDAVSCDGCGYYFKAVDLEAVDGERWCSECLAPYDNTEW